jgi:WD40 repeat protein
MADGDKGKGGGGDGEDTFIQKQREKNELKLKLQAYGDVWEYKTFRWGPFSWKKKVPKQGVEDVLKDERMHMMELDPDADPIPLEDADGNPIEPEEEDVGPSSNQMDQYKALGEHEDHAPKKKMTMVEKFGKMFEAVEVAKTTKDDDDGGAPSPLMTMLSPVKRERKTKKKKRRKKQVDDEFELDQAYRPPTPETKPVSRETKLDKATSKKEGFQWDLRSSWQTYWIYISSTSEDMLAELKLIFEEIVPELQKDGNKKRVRIIPVYLQDGLTAVETHQCAVDMRLREIERAHCVIFLQGRVYGDIPSEVSLEVAKKDFPWLEKYDSGRSFQEYEICHVFPELQLKKDSTANERRQAKKDADALRNDLIYSELVKKRILVVQRGINLLHNVPEHMHGVFKDKAYRKDVLQRELRTRVTKACQNNPFVDVLPDYKASFEVANDDGTYVMSGLHELEDFLLRNCREHIGQVYPNSGFGKWLRKNNDIDAADQAIWALRAKDVTMAHSREDEIDKMTKYCDGQNILTPLLIVGGSGAGKTSLMLSFMLHYLDTKDPNRQDSIISKGWRSRAKCLFLSHFTCASTSARNPVRMLKRFCTKIADHYFLGKPDDVPGDYTGLSERFRQYCQEVGTSFRGDMLMVMVDSIDEFEMWNINSEHYIPKESASSVDWVPEKLSTMPLFPVRMILSIDPDAAPDTLDRLRNQQKAYQLNEISIVSMDISMRMDALRKMLAKQSRTPFDLEKVIRIVSKIEACSIPMFMHYAALDLTVNNPSIQEMEAKALHLPTNVSELCFQSIMRVEKEVDGGTGYVREILMLLVCARRGLLESEMWQLVKMQSAMVRRRPKYFRFIAALQGLKPFFRAGPIWSDRGGEHCFNLCHELFSRIILSRLVKNLHTEQTMHRKLADLFYQGFLALNLERLSNGAARWFHCRIITDEHARGLGEVVFHACKAHMFDSVRELLCSLRFIELRIMFSQLSELLEDYVQAIHLFKHYPEQDGIQQLTDFELFVRHHAPDLIARPSNTFQLAANAPIQSAPAIVSRAMLSCNTERRVWMELRNKKQDKALTCHFECKFRIIELCMTPDSRYVAAIADDRGRQQTIHIFDTFLAIRSATMFDYQHYTTCGAFFASGNIIATGSKDGIITFWDILAQQQDGHMKAHCYPNDEDKERSAINRIKISNDMRYMITAGNDFTVKVFDPNHQDLQATLKGHRGPVLDVDISVDNHCFVSASADKTLRVWSSSSFQCLQHCIGHFGSVISCSFGGIAHSVFASSSIDGSVRTWQTDTGAVINVFMGHKGHVNCAAMGVTGPQVVSTGDDGTVRVWDTSDGCQMDQYGRERPEQLHIPEGHEGACNRCLLTRDCLRAISSGDDGFVKIWRMRGGHEKRINSLSFTEDQTRMVTCSDDKTVRSFDVVSTTELTKIVGHVGPINQLSTSPGLTSWEVHGLERRSRNQTVDTCVIATAADDCEAAIYNINTGVRMHKLTGHTKEVTQVAFSPNGELLATASKDACIGIWDTRKGILIHMLGMGSSAGMGHTGDVNGILFTKDSKSLLSVSSDTSCRVWDIFHGYLKALLSGHSLGVYCVDYSPTSDRVVTGSKDKNVMLWNMWKVFL